ncbi:MAG: hypothetical protein HY343_05860 [Lentisphaerae bacterium]|nr:hypothetical protein [Lentisphaerota bacterium]
MQLCEVARPLAGYEARDLNQQLAAGLDERRLGRLTPMPGSAAAALAMAIHGTTGRCVVLVTDSAATLDDMHRNLTALATLRSGPPSGGLRSTSRRTGLPRIHKLRLAAVSPSNSSSFPPMEGDVACQAVVRSPACGRFFQGDETRWPARSTARACSVHPPADVSPVGTGQRPSRERSGHLG